MIPTLHLDLFSDDVLANPYDHYRAVRDAGPVVRLDSDEAMVAIARYEDVRAAMRDWRAFRSSEGIGFNEVVNAALKDSILGWEPPVHTVARSAITTFLKASEMRKIASSAANEADNRISALVDRPEFDVVEDLADPFVASLVQTVFGVPSYVTDLFLAGGGSAQFMVVGPLNDRSMAVLPILQALDDLLGRLKKSDMTPGSILWTMLDAEDRGEIPNEMRGKILSSFIGAAFDTTIAAIGSAIWLFATNPEQWDDLRKHPLVVPAAINEVVRFQSPIHTWGRYCSHDTTVSGVIIPAGTRVALMLAAANRDERHYPLADMFDIRRDAADHLGFGHGIHACVGAPFARTLLTSLLNSLVSKVARIELAGEPVPRLNNTIREFDSLPVKTFAAS